MEEMHTAMCVIQCKGRATCPYADLIKERKGNMNEENKWNQRKYYEWVKKKNDRVIAIEFHVLTNRYTTPEGERVFPDDREIKEIDIERYVLLVRNWGKRLHKELQTITERKDNE